METNTIISDFTQGGFYVNNGSEYASAQEIRSGWIDTAITGLLVSLTISVDCGDLQWSFICCDDQGDFREISKSLGYKNSGTVIDLSDSLWVRKIRIELHSNNGLTPPQSCTLNVNYTYAWTMKNGYPVPTNAPELPEKAVTEPFPVSLWRVDKNKNGGYPFTGLMILTEPKGAFRKAEKLERVYIPESVKRIGAEAFRYTALKTVRIAPDCEYSPTSFPEGCEVEFYGGGGDYGQLYDSDGYAVLDCEAARIYVKE